MTIVLLETIHPDAHKLLEEVGEVILCEDRDPTTVVAPAEIQAIITRGRGQIRRPLLEQCPNLRAVARCGVGLDNIDTQAAAERKIAVVYAPGSTTTAVAEHTLMLMLSLSRRLVTLASTVAQGNWAIRNGYSSVELAGLTLGIVGLGDIGSRVARLASAFDMQIVYWSRTPKADAQYPYLALSDLLRTADIVSLHLALTPQTRRILGADELAQMKPSAMLINTARGALIDQDALYHALTTNQLAGFAADVLESEPPVAGERLLPLPNVIITPHTAALTGATYRAMCLSTAANVAAILQGQPADPRSLFVAPVTAPSMQKRH